MRHRPCVCLYGRLLTLFCWNLGKIPRSRPNTVTDGGAHGGTDAWADDASDPRPKSSANGPSDTRPKPCTNRHPYTRADARADGAAQHRTDVVLANRFAKCCTLCRGRF